MKCAKSVFVVLGFALLSPAPFPLIPAAHAQEQLWLRQFGTSGNDAARALAPDGAGGVMVAGFTTGSLGGPNAGENDAFLARYDSAGSQLWIRQFGTINVDMGFALAPDGVGGVMVVGRTEGELGGPHAGEADVFLARYDGTGNQLWIQQFGTNVDDYAVSIAPDGVGGVMVAGWSRDGQGVAWVGRTRAPTTFFLPAMTVRATNSGFANSVPTW